MWGAWAGDTLLTAASGQQLGGRDLSWPCTKKQTPLQDCHKPSGQQLPWTLDKGWWLEGQARLQVSQGIDRALLEPGRGGWDPLSPLGAGGHSLGGGQAPAANLLGHLGLVLSHGASVSPSGR